MTNQICKVGYQGVQGSWNEQAALVHLAGVGLTNVELVPLETTENVLRALDAREIDFGQFALHNSLGGNVKASHDAMVGRNFSEVARYALTITHALMTGEDVPIEEIDTVITHDQVERQCRGRLNRDFGRLKVVAGKDEDPAKVADLISKGLLPRTTSTCGNPHIARLYKLKIVADNMQDSDDNVTTFLLVKRPEEGFNSGAAVLHPVF